MDKWIDLTMEDIRNMEEKTKEELDKVTESLICHLLQTSLFKITHGLSQGAAGW